MRRAVANMNPFLRGMAIVVLIAIVVVVLQLQATLAALFLLARIAFFLAIAFFLYMVWRERRGDIATWSRRAQGVLYGSIALLLADVGWFVVGGGHHGLDALAFVVVLAAGAFALWRTWRDQHTYGSPIHATRVMLWIGPGPRPPPGATPPSTWTEAHAGRGPSSSGAPPAAGSGSSSPGAAPALVPAPPARRPSLRRGPQVPQATSTASTRGRTCCRRS
jgi:hypothetical protein